MIKNTPLLANLFETLCRENDFIGQMRPETFSMSYPRDLGLIRGTYFLLEYETGEGWFIERRKRTDQQDLPLGVITDYLKTPQMEAFLRGALAKWEK